MRPTSLLRRFETVDEIASVVAFVCSPLAAGMNGSSIRVEGGLVKAIAGVRRQAPQAYLRNHPDTAHAQRGAKFSFRYKQRNSALSGFSSLGAMLRFSN